MGLNFVQKAKTTAKPKSKVKTSTAGTLIKKPVAEETKPVTKKAQTQTTAKATTAKKTVKKSATLAKKKATGTKVVSPTDLKKKIKPLIPELAEAKRLSDAAAKEAAGVKKNYTEQEKAILGLVTDSGLDNEMDLKVENGNAVVTIGVSKETRTIKDNVAVFNALQELDEELPWKLLGFKLSDLDKYLGKTQLDKLVDTKDTGKRTLTLKIED